VEKRERPGKIAVYNAASEKNPNNCPGFMLKLFGPQSLRSLETVI
jgi:hypothetical protein